MDISTFAMSVIIKLCANGSVLGCPFVISGFMKHNATPIRAIPNYNTSKRVFSLKVPLRILKFE